MPKLTANQVVSNIMRAMYRKPGKPETPEQLILLNALRLHGLDKQVRQALGNAGSRKEELSATSFAVRQEELKNAKPGF